MNPKNQVFHAFTNRYSGITDRIITEVVLCAAFDANNPPAVMPRHIKALALWDTGATRSVVTPSAVQKLGLVSVGTALQTHAGGTSQCNTYMVNFFLPNNVGICGVLATDCADARQFEAIVGMDIITRGDFTITNVGGKTIVSYRFPSMDSIDYVDEANRMQFRGVGRNDPCPCGSGKKFKQCHKDKLNL